MAKIDIKDTSGKKDWSSSTPWTHADAVKATPETCFSGFDAYQKVIASGVDLVILATPPAFRPVHLKAAVDAGSAAAGKVGELVASHVIPRPSSDLLKAFIS